MQIEDHSLPPQNPKKHLRNHCQEGTLFYRPLRRNTKLLISIFKFRTNPVIFMRHLGRGQVTGYGKRDP